MQRWHLSLLLPGVFYRVSTWSLLPDANTVRPRRTESSCLAAAGAKRTNQRQVPAFDFSEPTKWNEFYQENHETYEWHSSVSLERIASYVPEDSWCVIIGCGNSRLPETILAAKSTSSSRIVLLDTSQVCLDQLRSIYGSSVDYVCGDATEMSSALLNTTARNVCPMIHKFDHISGDEQTRSEAPRVDIVLDKGLMDAILCGEGWDGTVRKLLEELSRVLRPGGTYLLVSYRLPNSTKSFLCEVGKEYNLQWNFDIEPDSNPRVSVSVATKH